MRLRRWTLAAPALLVLACAGEQVNDLRLDVDPVGFACTEDAADGSPLLIARAVEGDSATGELNLVVDYVRFQGLPSCRPNRILEACATEGCPVIRRNCISLDARAVAARIEGTFDAEVVIAALTAEIGDDRLITYDAPDDVVLIRVVGTTQSCDSLAGGGGVFPAYRCDLLLGCGYSCAGQLDEVSGSVDVSLDSLGAICTAQVVEVCAGLGRDGFVLAQQATWCER